MSKIKELEKQFAEAQKEQKNKIREEPNKWKRFWKWIWYLIVFPWKWIWINIRDWRTAVIFIIVLLVVSSEVWIPYIIWFITKNGWWLGIGSACWLFWLGPGTPFLVICIGLTILIKGLFNKIKARKENKRV